MAGCVPTTMRDFFFEDPHFKTTWDQFEKIRDSMFKESRDLWKDMDNRGYVLRPNLKILTSSEFGQVIFIYIT